MITSGLPVVDVNACTACGHCVDWCPAGAVGIVENKAVIIRPEDCTYCTDCETVCPAGAIKCPFSIVLVSRDSRVKTGGEN